MRNHIKNPGDIERIEQLAEEGSGRFEDYYELSAAGEMEASEPYYGRNVVWDGIGGRMIRVYPGYAEAIDGNIFDPDKLAAVRDGIKDAADSVVFVAPYGTVTVVGLQDVKESIEYENDYPDHVLTTGDEDLDLWLVDPDEFLSQEGYDPADLNEYVADKGAYLEFWSDDPEDRLEKAEEMEAALVLSQEMNRKLEEAVDANDGDLGQFIFSIRDGNHRAFGSFLAGEPYIWMILEDNQFQDLDPDNPDDKFIIKALA